MSSLPRAALAELVGTFVFFTIGAGSVIVATSTGELGLIGVALAHGLSLAVMVTIFGGISGGHFNPAVTLGVLVGGRIEPLRAAVYVGAQLVGGVFAGLLLKQMFVASEYGSSNLGTPAIGLGVSVGRAILVEAVLTFFLVLAVWGTGVDPRGASVGGFGIGLAVFFDILVGGPLTGAAMNPARHFGPALASGFWADWWVYWLGPLLGGALGGLLYATAFWEEPEEGVMPAVAAGAARPDAGDGPDG